MGKLISLLIPDSMRLAWLNLRRNQRRSAMSMLIISIAVFALTATGGFGLYTYQSLKESTARDIGHLIISTPDYFQKDEEMPLSNGLEQPDDLVKKIIALDSVRGVQPNIAFTGLISNGNKSAIYIGNGVNEREFDMKGPFLDVQQGKTLSNLRSSRYDPAEPEVMLAVDLARNLNVTIGDWVTLLATTTDGALNAYDFKVHGIYSTGVPEMDKRQLFVHIDSAQDLLYSEKVSTISVFLFDLEQTEVVSQAIDRLIAQQAQALEITPWHERAFYYQNVKNLYDRIFGIMGLIMALVVFVALFNTMTMSVTERTREIGTLSALGNYPNEIIGGFMREAGLLAVIGSLFGVLATGILTLFLMVVDVQMPPPPGMTQGYPLTIYFSFSLAVWALLGVLAICLTAAFFSARKGVNKPITEALIHV
ncbi:ABC transporter permease [Vibrio scophthalmi]|uniref:ABC-type transport system involved in lipoprotein release permease component n=1 Tax=Vibrio scophthalmi LMG 19158 TaxID=870967 RepID=F9RML5_9VIBR|nr:FtsX-like permease family protein [Vibrio scophthalmi]EGU38331.1 ABC-type transport system involved in lipoprotein release permease component [Vibrio scophthalmi LMG 19158]